MDDLKKTYIKSKKEIKVPTMEKVSHNAELIRDYFAKKRVYQLCKNNLELGLKHINGYIRVKRRKQK